MKTFRTIEISDSRFESGNLKYITVKSGRLKGRGDVVVFQPEAWLPETAVPVVILLHGVYGSAWSWPLKSGVHLRTHDLIVKRKLPPCILAMPSDGLWGDGSGYVAHDGYDFDKWIAEDVPQLLMQTVKGVDEQSPFFITGLSMGGFGAMKIGAKYPERFLAFTGHSSITNLEQMKLFVEEDMESFTALPAKEKDVLTCLKAHQSTLPPFQFDCGNADPLLEANSTLHQQLKDAGIPHTYQEFTGGHEWPYWEKHILESLLFFGKRMGEM